MFNLTMTLSCAIYSSPVWLSVGSSADVTGWSQLMLPPFLDVVTILNTLQTPQDRETQNSVAGFTDGHVISRFYTRAFGGLAVGSNWYLTLGWPRPLRDTHGV